MWLISTGFMKTVEKSFRVLGRSQNCYVFYWIFGGWVSQLYYTKDFQQFSRLLWCHGSWENHFCESFIDIIALFFSLLGTAPISSGVLSMEQKKKKEKIICIASLMIVECFPYFPHIFLYSSSLLLIFLCIVSTVWINRVRHWAESSP